MKEIINKSLNTFSQSVLKAAAWTFILFFIPLQAFFAQTDTSAQTAAPTQTVTLTETPAPTQTVIPTQTATPTPPEKTASSVDAIITIQKTADVNQRLIQYRDYFSKNKDLVTLDLLKQLLAAEKEVSIVTTLFKENIPNLKNREDQGRAYAITGSLFQLTFQINDAQSSYLLASTLLKGKEQLAAVCISAALLFEQGLFEKSLEQLESIPGSIEERSTVAYKTALKGICFFELAKYPAAEEQFTNVLSDYPESPYAPVVIYYYMQIPAVTKEKLKELKTTLENTYSQSPEFQILINSKFIKRTSTPVVLLNEKKPDTITANPTPTAAALSTSTVKPSGLLYIQTGSFTVKDNALALQSTLKKKGYEVTIREKIVQAKLFYVVLVSFSASASTSDAMLKQLKNQGFTGFAVIP